MNLLRKLRRWLWIDTAPDLVSEAITEAARELWLEGITPATLEPGRPGQPIVVHTTAFGAVNVSDVVNHWQEGQRALRARARQRARRRDGTTS